MKLYEGTKRLRAQPMTRGEYNEYRDWQIPANENPAEAGYLVEYEDGGKSNDYRHAGYISWSPADVFERTYKPVLEPHQQRVVEEKQELDTKATALLQFINGAVFQKLPVEECIRLSAQHAVMERYSGIVAERIAAFAA